MKKADLAAKLQDFLGGTNTQATSAVQMIFDEIMSTVKNGEDVEIAGFGKFSKANRAARTARNPRTGEEVQVPAHGVAKFKPAKAFKDMVK